MSILEVLSMADEVDINKYDGSNNYEVSLKCYDSDTVEIVACISKDLEISYWIRGVYNSGSDYAEVNLKDFSKLKLFCEKLVEVVSK